MKKAILPILALALLTIGCGGKKNDDNADVNTRNRGVEPAIAASLPRGGYYGIQEGSFQIQTTYATEFERAVRSLVSTHVAPEEVGSIASSPLMPDQGGTQASGVTFIGNISLSGNTVLPQDSFITITIRDSNTSLINPDTGAPYSAIAINVPLKSGHFSGSNATLLFEDDWGTISMVGAYDQSYFKGTLTFANKKLYTGSTPGTSGTIGNFAVRTCGFFRCQ